METYRITLASDAEILDAAYSVYTENHMILNETSLDSSFFGANSTANTNCSICKQDVYSCPGHYSVIQLPIPIPRSLVCKDLINLLQCICPICAKLLLPFDELEKIKLITPKYRLLKIKTLIQAEITRMEGALFICPNCGNGISSTITTLSTQMPDLQFYIKNPQTTEWSVVNPIEVQAVLQHFDQIEEIGFSTHYHPKNFMSSYIPILPSKLRAKGIHNESALTTYYSSIIQSVLPKLENVKSFCISKNTILIADEKLKEFTEYYAKLQAYYMLITDVKSDKISARVLEVLGKQQNLRFDSNNCIVRRFKGKDKSIMTKGIIDMTHDRSVRVVLGNGANVSIRELIVPFNIANRMMFNFPVYDVNINFIKSMILKMNDSRIRTDPTIPKIIAIWQHKYKNYCDFNPNKASSLAEMLQPGDQICLSICNNDLVMESRHPANIEECLTSFRVVKQFLSVVGMPLPVCKVKAADFDGDEIQLFLCSSHWTDISALLLHSVERQIRSYKTGAFSFWFDGTHDDAFGTRRIGDYKIHLYNHKVFPNGKNVLDVINENLPQNLNYDSDTIKVKDGKIDKNCYNFMDKPFFKYIHSIYGPRAMVDLLNMIEQLAYDINRELGATLGFEIRFHGNSAQRERINELVAQSYEEARITLKKRGQMDQVVANCIEKNMPEIKKILVESSAGANFDKLGLLKDRSEEFVAMFIHPSIVRNDDGFIKASLADGMRTSACGYRFSYDPEDYGYFDRGFAFDNDPLVYQFAVAAEELAIYQKFAGTAKQGYFANRLGITYGRTYLDYNGCVVDGKRLIGTQYGCCGLDPRNEVQIPLKDIDLDNKEFANKHSDPRLLELKNSINFDVERYNKITNFLVEKTRNNLITGIDFNQILNSAKKGKTPQNEIDEFIKNIYSIFIPDALKNYLLHFEENFKKHEYYFRIKLEEVVLDDKLKNMIFNSIRFMLGNAGEPIGMKAALSASEPLTQASLNAIHHKDAGGADVDVVNRVSGIRAFEQRLAGANVGESNVLTIRLFDDSEESCKNFALEQATFYFNEVFAKNELHIRRTIPREFYEMYGEIIGSIPVKPLFVISTWNMVKISKYNISVNDVINGLMDRCSDIVMILPKHLNSTQIEAYIYFDATINDKSIHELVNNWNYPSQNNIIHGGLICNCFVRESTNNHGHFVIECNEADPKINSFKRIIYDPRVDPQTSLNADPNITFSIYGIFEAGARIYDSLLYAADTLSDTKELLQRVYKTIASTMSVSGKLIYATKPSLIHDHDNDLLKNIKFQDMPGFITEYAKYGKLQKFNEWVPSAVFQQQPGFGEGVSKVIIHP